MIFAPFFGPRLIYVNRIAVTAALLAGLSVTGLLDSAVITPLLAPMASLRPQWFALINSAFVGALAVSLLLMWRAARSGRPVPSGPRVAGWFLIGAAAFMALREIAAASFLSGVTPPAMSADASEETAAVSVWFQLVFGNVLPLLIGLWLIRVPRASNTDGKASNASSTALNNRRTRESA